jgi:ADP-ribose pyrophosphatase YjhB (NUDIX family)
MGSARRFVNMDELLETACKRELKEETGLAVEKMTSLKPSMP